MLRLWLGIVLRTAGLVWLGVVAFQICHFSLGRRVNTVVLVFVCTEAPVAAHLLYLLLCRCCRGPPCRRCLGEDRCRLGLPCSITPSKGEVRHPSLSVLALVDLLVLAALAGVNMRVLSYNSAWCYQRPGLTKEMCALVNRISDTLASQSVTYWLCHGSLLGAARSGAPLSWDHDTDICILDNVAQAGRSLVRAGIDVEFHPESKMTPARVLMPGADWSILAETWVDLHQFALFKLNDLPGEELLSTPDTTITRIGGQKTGPANSVDANLIVDQLRRNMPLYKNQTFPLAQLPYCGRMLPVPQDYEQALRTKFGAGWRVPVEPRGVQGWACRLWMDSEPWLGLR
mmetsp:Transcript_69035/g.180932  ORF Transcript_69035/g.180932 Transcript_69035/m.180932 type:complete len:344 (+) Transcript_69035:99-1130(+)